MKQELRGKILDQRNNLGMGFILEKSAEIKERLFKLPEFRKADVVMFYVSYNSEVHTHEMIELSITRKKRVCAPKIVKEDIVPGYIYDILELVPHPALRILEPPEIKKVNKADIQAVIVPGIVFDACGHRIGYSKGMYDRFLKGFNGTKIGLCFDFQLIAACPIEQHDVPMDFVITETKTLKIKKEETSIT